MRLRSILHFVAKVGRPLLRIFGVKDSSVAGKVAQGVEVVDGAIPPEEKKP